MSATGLSPHTWIDGRYQLEAPLDGWGLGETWLAKDKNFRGRPVVLSMLPTAAAEVAGTLAAEFRAQRATKHPAIGAVINQGVASGRPWVAFDQFEGVSLARFVEEQRRTRASVDRATAEGIADKLIDAFVAAHEAATPLLHGCLHPACVIVKPPALKVVDFGLGACFDREVLGPFRAPEQQQGAASLASDVYALGVVLTDLLMPQTVGDARRALEALLAALVRDGGTQAGRSQRADIPAGVWEAIARAVRRDPGTRWDDVGAFREALRAGWASAAAPVAPAPLAAPAPTHPATTAGIASPIVAPMAPAFTAPLQRPLTPAQPAAPPAFTSPPTPAATPGAWGASTPASHDAARAVIASAWDSSGATHGHWGSPPQTPLVAGVHTSEENEWEPRTRAMDRSSHLLHGHDDQRSHLASALQEPTRALDFDALREEATVRPSAAHCDDDWKDSVVVLNTSSQATDEEADMYEPGSRTRVAQPPKSAFDATETLPSVPRDLSVVPLVASGLPANQESTFIAQSPLLAPASQAAVPSGVVPAANFMDAQATMRAPSGALPAQPQVARAPTASRRSTEFQVPPPPPSRTLLYVAIAVALVLIAGAVLFVTLRRG